MKTINYLHVFDFNQPELDLLHRVLAAAGFLLERRADFLEFSDNSAMLSASTANDNSDPGFLERLSRKHRWFGVSGKRVLSTRPIEPTDLTLFFDRTVQSEGFWDGSWSTWRRFSNYRGRGAARPETNLPAVILEPRIAGLVRAFRAVGIHTIMSCHGHPAMEEKPHFKRRAPTVWFTNPFAFFWMQALLERRYTKLCAASQARFVAAFEPWLVFPFLDEFPDAGWKALFEIAWRIYNERLELRERKAQLCARVAGTALEEKLARYGAGPSPEFDEPFVELRSLMAEEAGR